MLSLKQIKNFFINSPKNGDVMMYNSSTQKWVNATIPKIWTGSGTVGSNGQFTVSFPVGYFSSPPKVFVQARNVGNATRDQNFASISSVTASAVTGVCSNSLTTGLLLVYVLTHAASGTVVDVVAIGSY